jgi:hypothetical protein
LANQNFSMDELVQQLGMAASNLSECIPAQESWCGPAASALTAELEQISSEIGAVILDLLSNNTYSMLERLQLG